jgi:hypothetical protein
MFKQNAEEAYCVIRHDDSYFMFLKMFKVVFMCVLHLMMFIDY